MLTRFISLLESKHFYDAIQKHRKNIEKHPELYAANPVEKRRQVDQQLSELEFSYTLNANPFFVNISKHTTSDFVKFHLFTTGNINVSNDVRQDFVADYNDIMLQQEIIDLASKLKSYAINQITSKINEI
jgi:hypothetical protein